MFTPSGSGKEVIRNIQVLRGLAALLVIFVHLDRLLHWLDVPAFGGGGVEVFFVISGFIMVYTTGDRSITPLSFLKDRVARVVPPYWAVTLVVFAIALVAPGLLQATHANWTDLLKSLAFVPFLKVNGAVEPILFVGWSLNYEVFFYLVFAAGLAFANRGLGIACVCVVLLMFVVSGAMLGQQGVLLTFYTSPASLDFVLGVMIGLIYPSFPRRAPVWIRTITALIVFLSLWPLILLPLAAPDASPFMLCAIPAGLIVAASLLLELWGWTIRSALLLRLGAASYSIYLVHPFVTQAIQEVAAHVHPHAATALLLLTAATVAAAAAGLVAYQGMERPLLRAARQLLQVERLNPRGAWRSARVREEVGSPGNTP